jgi:CheY-like chemotaxis protein
MIAPEELEFTEHNSLHGANSPGQSQCVLLAEDDPALRRYLEVVLQRAGYDVVSAADGLEAMKVLLSTPVDAVVTDALMPNLTGYELCRFIRNSQRLSHLPIVLLSALDQKNATSENEHVNAFLAKPVSPEDLLVCLASLMVPTS